MRRVLLAILTIGITIKCTEILPTDTISQSIAINGFVSTDNPVNDLSGIVVWIESDRLYSDTTNSEGVFNFEIERIGVCRLTINDTSYHAFDSIVVISDETTIDLKLKSKNKYVISGKVLNPLNQPIWGLQVRLDGRGFLLEKTQKDGSFEFVVNDIGEY